MIKKMYALWTFIVLVESSCSFGVESDVELPRFRAVLGLRV